VGGPGPPEMKVGGIGPCVPPVPTPMCFTLWACGSRYIVWSSFLYGYFYCAKFCLQYETLMMAIRVKKAFVFTW